MSATPDLRGPDPREVPSVPNRPRAIRPGVRMIVRGRSIHLRGLHHPPTGALRWLLLLGPGLIAGAAGDDAGGIATYAQTGAKYGYDLLWVMILITVSLAVVQEMCARLGAATGRGLLDLIRERYGIGWAVFAIATILLTDGGLVLSEFVGIGAGMELFGITKYVAVPLAALLVWSLVVAGSYGPVEKVFVVMTLALFAYPIAAVLAHPDWGAVLRGSVVPTLKADPNYVLLFVALIGTTISPYQQLFQQSSVVDRGTARRHYGPERVDTYVGMVFSNVISWTIIVATAATLHAAGKTDVDTAAAAAEALRPVAGDFAQAVFAVGLIGASLLAAAVLPLATAYAVAEAFGFPKGVNLDFRRGRVFLGLFSAMVVLGAAVALIPGVPVIQFLVGVQVLNGVLLPIILFFLLRLINDRRLVGDLANSRLYNVLGWGTFTVVTLAVLAYLGSQALALVGISVGG